MSSPWQTHTNTASDTGLHQRIIWLSSRLGALQGSSEDLLLCEGLGPEPGDLSALSCRGTASRGLGGHTSWVSPRRVSPLLHTVSCRAHPLPGWALPSARVGCGWPEGQDALSMECGCRWAPTLAPGLGPRGWWDALVTMGRGLLTPPALAFEPKHHLRRKKQSNFTRWGFAESSNALMCSETGHGSNNPIPEAFAFVPGAQEGQRGRITGNWSEFRVAQLLAGCKIPNPIVLLQPFCHMWSAWASLVKIFSLYMEDRLQSFRGADSDENVPAEQLVLFIKKCTLCSV